jgi:hypothetical protein
MPSINTPKQLKNEILSRLGSPINTIEVTEDQVYRCIDRAVELYTEYHSDGMNKHVGVHQVTEAESKSGLFVFANQPIIAITHVYKSTPYLNASWYDGAIYDTMWHFGADMVKQFQMGMGSGGNFFTNLEVFYQYRELQQQMMSPDPDFAYNAQTRQLRLFDTTIAPGTVLFIECWVASTTKIDKTLLTQDQILTANSCTLNQYTDQVTCEANGGYWLPAIQSYENPNVYTGILDAPGQGNTDTYYPQESFNDRWLKDMATALVKEQWAWNLFKFKDQALPGGTTVNADAIMTAAQSDIEKLRAELMLIEAPCEFWMG